VSCGKSWDEDATDVCPTRVGTTNSRAPSGVDLRRRGVSTSTKSTRTRVKKLVGVYIAKTNLLRVNSFELHGRPRYVCEDLKRGGSLIGGSRDVESANVVLRWATDADASRWEIKLEKLRKLRSFK